MPKHTTTNPNRAHDLIPYEVELFADLEPAIEPQALPSIAPAIQGDPVSYKGERVLTTEMAAKAFEVEPGRIITNFNRNLEHFVEGRHFHRIVGDELRDLKNSMSQRHPVGSTARSIMLWTDRGIARHAKMLETDTAWKIFTGLEDTYFAVKEAVVAEVPAIPNFADPVAAARAWADEREARSPAEKRRAEIGSRREAQAMATASAATRQAKKLRIELDIATAWATVRRMEAAYPGRKFAFAPLKAASTVLALEIKSVPDPRYTKLNSYHALAWREAYGVDVPGWTGEGDAE